MCIASLLLWDLKAEQINVPCYPLCEFNLYESELGQNTTKAIKNIYMLKVKVKVWLITDGSRNFVQVTRILAIRHGQVGLRVWILGLWRCLWCNGYCCRKWAQRHEFKSWKRLIVFLIALIPFRKVWIQLFSLQLWVNSREDWVLQPWWGNSSRRRKILNSNLLNSA